MLIPFFRTLLLFALIIIAVRFMGKRQVGEMQPTELVVTILVSAVASVPMQDIDIPLLHGVIPILTLIAAEVILSSISLKYVPFRRILSGNPITVIQDGKIDQENLKKLRLSIDDVCEDLRLKDIFDLRQVKYAQMETNGRLSVLINTLDSPATARMLSLSPIGAEPFHVLISDGYFSKESLASLGRGRDWMESVMRANGADKIKDVFLFCADKSGNIIFSKKGRTN